MSKLSLTLRQTDQSHLLEGHCSISHALSLIKQSVPQAEHPNGHAIRSLRSMGFHLLSHIGGWSVNCQNLTTFTVRTLPPGNWSLTQKKNWDLIKIFFSQAQIGALFSGPADLLFSRSCRQHQAEKFIQSIVCANLFLPSKASLGTQLWGTDGSMVPASAGPLDDKSVTSAITGPCTIVMKPLGHNISILHGELVGIIGGLILSDPLNDSTMIYTDHLNSTRQLNFGKH
jgi:hypothetical protein